MEKRILTLDVGTTAVKASLFTGGLGLLTSAAEEYPLDTAPGGIVECPPERYIRAAKASVARALAKAPNGEVIAIGVTTQGETLLPVDREGSPLAPAVVWLDARAERQARAIAARLDGGRFYARTGLPEINGALPLAKLAWFREERPNIYKAAAKFLLVEDYLLHWLTGRFVTEKALQCSTGWFDIIADGYWGEALAAAGISPEKLPEPLPCGEPVGELLPGRAAELGLPPGAVAVTGAMDQVAAALGAGVTGPGRVCETTGTALVMAAYTAAPDFSQESRVTVYRHAFDGGYLYLPIGNTGGRTLTWFRDNFCPDLDSYAQMDALAERVPPGCEGLVTLPYLAGCVNPDNDPDARAVFFGASLHTSRAHFIRSVMESIGFCLREFLEMLASLGVTADEVQSLGGGSRSAVWQQIKADACGVPFAAAESGEAASLGAAMLAAKGLGLPGAARAAVGRRAEPVPERRAAYDEAYETFRALYRAVKPFYKRKNLK